MAGKLVRNTSTQELRDWWEAVERVAASAPELEFEDEPDRPAASAGRRKPKDGDDE